MMASCVISMSQAQSSGWDELVFTAAETDVADGAMYISPMNTFALTVFDAGDKATIDANACGFGTSLDDSTKYSFRLKSGATSSSANNYMVLSFVNDGYLRIASRSASSSATDRNLVVTQDDGSVLYNQVVQEADTIVDKLYPYITVPVKAGNVMLTYPTGALNFYSFAFIAPITVRLDPRSCSDWSQVGIWAWTQEGNVFDSWPGAEVSLDADGWYSYTFAPSVQSVSIIWNDFGTGGRQTYNIEDITASTCYSISPYDNTYYNFSTIDCSTDVRPNYPTPQYFANMGIDLDYYYVLCFNVPNDCSNSIAFPGSYNGWQIDDNLAWLTPLNEYEGWYYTLIPNEGSAISGKPVSVQSTGVFNWNYQAGDAGAWEHVAGKQAYIANSSDIPGEADVVFNNGAGAYIYRITYWKNYADPCATISGETDYTVNLYLPSNTCDDFTPVVLGDFNNWELSTAVVMTDTTDGAGHTYYTATVSAYPSTSFKFCDQNRGWDSEIQQYSYGYWNAVPNSDFGNDTVITVDYSGEQYRVSGCPIHNARVTVLVPTDCNVDISEGLYIYWYSDGGGRELAQMTALGGRKFTYTFDPNAAEYNYNFRNRADYSSEGYIYTYSQTGLTDTTLCWEIQTSMSESSTSRGMRPVPNCELEDHDYRPTNVQVVNPGGDTIRISWNSTINASNYYLYGYDEDGDVIVNKSFGSDKVTNNTATLQLENAEPITVASWKLRLETYFEQAGYYYYEYYYGETEGCTVAGDTRMPHNLTVTEINDSTYRIAWESSLQPSLFDVTYRGGYAYHEDSTTNLYYDLVPEANSTYYITVYAKDQSGQRIGQGAEIQFETYRREPRDISLYFYIPEHLNFLGANGGAINWNLPNIAGSHLVSLVEDEDANGHWYKATVANFDRDAFTFSLLNATTTEAATKSLSYSYSVSSDMYFIVKSDKNGILSMTSDYASALYPHDYAVTNLQAEQSQVDGSIRFTWNANEEAMEYYVYVYLDENATESYTYTTDSTTCIVTNLSFMQTATRVWYVVPVDNRYNTYHSLGAYSTYTAGISPSVATNLRIAENEDGTFTFGWTPAKNPAITRYWCTVYDPSGSRTSSWDTSDTTYTTGIDALFGGNYTFRVYSYDSEWNEKGYNEQTFTIAPAEAHDVALRVLITDNSGIDTSLGVQFRIQTSPNNYITVTPTQEQYGWYSYTVSNTTARGIRFYVSNNSFSSNSRVVYSDACVELTDYRLNDVNCEARADDYKPYDLYAMPNGDGTYTLSWAIYATERVRDYYIEIQHPDSGWYTSLSARTTQCTTPILPYAGKYEYIVNVSGEDWITIGKAMDSIVVAPLAEREIHIRLLEQPAEEGWSAYQRWANGSSTPLNFNVESNGDQKPNGWYNTTISSIHPAVLIRINTVWGNRNEYWITGDTCLQIDNGVQYVKCDTVRQNFTLTNLHAEPQSDGKVKVSWDCAADPDGFWLQTLYSDTTAQAYWTFNGDRRSASILMSVDTITPVIWYMVPIKQRNDQIVYLWDFQEWGNNFTAVPSIYAPQNLQATPNNDGSYTLTWDPVLADTVKYYYIRTVYPDGQSNWELTQTNSYVTALLSELGEYVFNVYVLDAQHNTLAWSYTTATVTELEQARDITVRVLVHPDSGRDDAGSLRVYRGRDEYGDETWDIVRSTAESNHWYSYTFSSAMPAQKIRLLDYEQTVGADVCFEYEYNGGLKRAECNALPHDYRITEGSLSAVSEPGKVTLGWSAQQKSTSYELRLYHRNNGEYYNEYIGTYYAPDTCYTYLVPDEYDGQEMYWYVSAYSPVQTGSVRGETITMHKNAIQLSQFQATSTDSVNFHFTWQANTDTVQYEVMICRYGSSDQVLRKASVTQRAFDYTFISSDAGYFSWYVRAVNAEATPLTAWETAGEVYVKRGLEAVTNFEGATNGNMVTYTWTTTAPAVQAWLYYQQSANAGYQQLLDNDTILYTNSFSYQATDDGVYILEIRPMVEIAQGELQPIYEWHEASATYFSVATYNVAVSVAVGGRIFNNPSGNYPSGYQLWINVWPEDHYRFIGWSDGNAETDRQITVSQDTVLVAYFERIPQYTLTVNAAEGGMLRYTENEQAVTVAQYQHTYEQGEGIYMTAVPNEDYVFYQWSDGVTSDSRDLIGHSDTTFTALFNHIRYATIQASEGGRVSVNGAMQYNSTTKKYTCYDGLELTLRASADEGYRFTGWSDGDMNITRTITISSDTILTALFDSITTPLSQYVVRVLSSNPDLGEVSQVSGTYYEGDQLTFTATPKVNARFTGWSDGDMNATRTITVTQDTNLVAGFAVKRIAVSIHAGVGGTVNDSTANGFYDYDSYVTITATADEGYHFVQWSDGNTQSTRQLVLREDVELTASFERNIVMYAIRFLNYDGAVLQSGQVLEGDMPAYTGATPTRPEDDAYTYEFNGWSPAIVAATADADYTAQYTATAKPVIPDTVYYTVRFLNWDGTVLQSTPVIKDSLPVYTGATPTRPEDDNYTYEFKGWSPAIVAATADVDYTAQFTATAKPIIPDTTYYTIRFLNWDGTVLQSTPVIKNSLPVYTGETPTRPEDDTYTYEFNGWSPAIVAATADADYTAQYTATEKSQDIEDINADGSAPQKVMIDGNIYIIRGDKVYTLDGKLVK